MHEPKVFYLKRRKIAKCAVKLMQIDFTQPFSTCNHTSISLTSTIKQQLWNYYSQKKLAMLLGAKYFFLTLQIRNRFAIRVCATVRFATLLLSWHEIGCDRLSRWINQQSKCTLCLLLFSSWQTVQHERNYEHSRAFSRGGIRFNGAKVASCQLEWLTHV